MNDRELDRLIARANPYGDQTVADLPTGGAEADLLEEIVSTATPKLIPVDDPGRPPRRRIRRRLVLVAVAAATALIVLGGVFLPSGGGGPSAPPPAYAAELVAVAEANQRLIIDAPGWKIDYVGEFGATQGEMRFRNGSSTVSMMWGPAGQYRSYLQDRARESRPTEVDVLGRTGSMVHYSGSDFATMLPPAGPTFLEIRADLGSEKAYRDMLGKLRAVDVNTWLAALPASVITPDKKAAVITEMLADIPVPKGFDTKKLNTGTTTERYHVGARVAGTVACAWIDRWAAARKAGNDEGVREAVDALKSSRSWKVLREMQAQGAFPEVLWETVDVVVTGKVKLGKSSNPKEPTVESLKGGICY
ncbi:MAG TPA: hypothetical protein VFB74_25005 [Kribbellaceae bacterium]|nr:hypothetical protein [Kribbellaceae bacterium]